MPREASLLRSHKQRMKVPVLQPFTGSLWSPPVWAFKGEPVAGWIAFLLLTSLSIFSYIKSQLCSFLWTVFLNLFCLGLLVFLLVIYWKFYVKEIGPLAEIWVINVLFCPVHLFFTSFMIFYVKQRGVCVWVCLKWKISISF